LEAAADASPPSKSSMAVRWRFNKIMFNYEKQGGVPRPQICMDRFRDALLYCNLNDLGFEGDIFTWRTITTELMAIFVSTLIELWLILVGVPGSLKQRVDDTAKERTRFLEPCAIGHAVAQAKFTETVSIRRHVANGFLYSTVCS
jgi:hypothetical protein